MTLKKILYCRRFLTGCVIENTANAGYGIAIVPMLFLWFLIKVDKNTEVANEQYSYHIVMICYYMKYTNPTKRNPLPYVGKFRFHI